MRREDYNNQDGFFYDNHNGHLRYYQQHQQRERRGWKQSDIRAVLIGVGTFLLLQAIAQYQSLQTWEERMKRAQTSLLKMESSSSALLFKQQTKIVPQQQQHQIQNNIFSLSKTSNKYGDRDDDDHFSLFLPKWMEEYMVWHKQERNRLMKSNNWTDASFRFLIVRCLTLDADRCGTARHRLQSLPLAMLLANQSRRLLFVKWEQPAPLEEFLLPATSSDFDWRLPDWLHEAWNNNDNDNNRYEQYPTIRGTSRMAIQKVMDPNNVVVTLRHYSKDHGRTYYNEQRGQGNDDPSFDMIFRSFWFRFFQPSPPVQQLIQQDMDLLHLVKGRYIITYLPAAKVEKNSSASSLVTSKQQQQGGGGGMPRKNSVFAALDCARQVVPTAFFDGSDGNHAENDLTLVVATPSRSYIEYALEYTSNHMVALQTPATTNGGLLFALDKDDPAAWQKPDAASKHYQSFAFLYLMAYSQCVIFEHGYADGRWGTVLSYNPLCGARFGHVRSVGGPPVCEAFSKEEVLARSTTHY